jgi:hypothetical protein
MITKFLGISDIFANQSKEKYMNLIIVQQYLNMVLNKTHWNLDTEWNSSATFCNIIYQKLNPEQESW